MPSRQLWCRSNLSSNASSTRRLVTLLKKISEARRAQNRRAEAYCGRTSDCVKTLKGARFFFTSALSECRIIQR